MPIKFIKSIPLLLLLTGFSSFYQKTESGIKVNIYNLRNNKGHVLISLFKDGKGYPDKAEKAFKIDKATITKNKAELFFKELPPGNYAIAILHDQNDDQKMNTNFFGLPKEGYGFSNNVMGTFGPPGYSKASFNHSAGTITIKHIKTRY